MVSKEAAAQPRRDRREEILQASLHLFAEKGFHGTSMRDIARSADITEGLIYHYFASKRDLFRAIIDEHSFLPLLRTLPDIAGQLDLRALLIVLARGFFDVRRQNTELVVFRIGKNDPANVITLADVGSPGPEPEKPLEFVGLVPIRRIDI